MNATSSALNGKIRFEKFIETLLNKTYFTVRTHMTVHRCRAHQSGSGRFYENDAT